ncbi:hypothetical protein ABFX02_09G102700 [Erythranthe guttata]
MDRGKSVRTITAITVLMLLCAGQATASCYGDCLANCFNAGQTGTCFITCLFKCRKVELKNVDDPCKFNCAINRCSRFVSDVDKADDCMNKCETEECNQAKKTLPRQ